MSRYVDVQTCQIAGQSFTARAYECQVEEDRLRRYVVSEDGGPTVRTSQKPNCGPCGPSSRA